MHYNNNGLQELTERFPNAFEQIYKEKSGFLYFLDSTNFKESQTSFSPEVVSNKKEQVLHCEVIDDCYEKVCEMEKNNEVILFRYPNRPSHIPADDSDLIKIAKRIIERSQDKQRTVDNIIKSNSLIKDFIMPLSTINEV